MMYYALKNGAFVAIDINDGAKWLENEYTLWKKEEDMSYDVESIISETNDIADGTETEEEAEESDTTQPQVNLILTSIGDDNYFYNDGLGYKSGYTLNSDGAEEESEGFYVTGYMNSEQGSEFYLSDINLETTSTTEMIAFYDLDKMLILADSVSNMISNGYVTVTSDDSNNISKIVIASAAEVTATSLMRISSTYITNDSAIYEQEAETEDDSESEIEEEEITSESLIADGWAEITSDTLSHEILLCNVDSAETGFFVYKDIFTDSENNESYIYYIHNLGDEPNLYKDTGDTTKDGHVMGGDNENRAFPLSDLVWKMTAEGLKMSTDGGMNYPYELLVNGDAILNRINATTYLTIDSVFSSHVRILAPTSYDSRAIEVTSKVYGEGDSGDGDAEETRVFSVGYNGDLYANGDNHIAGYISEAEITNYVPQIHRYRALSQSIPKNDTGTVDIDIGSAISGCTRRVSDVSISGSTTVYYYGWSVSGTTLSLKFRNVSTAEAKTINVYVDLIVMPSAYVITKY